MRLRHSLITTLLLLLPSQGLWARNLFEQHLASFVDQGRIWLLAGTRGIDEWAMEWPGRRKRLNLIFALAFVS